MPRKDRELTQDEKEQILKMVEQGIPRKQIGETVKISWNSLKKFLDKNNIPKIKRGIPYEYYEDIFKLYKEGLTCKKIHDSYYPQFTVDQINHICQTEGITRKQGKVANCNHDYFSVIDNEEKAYWLGFLTADGCVKNEHGNSYSVSLSLMKKDKYLVEQFASDVETDLLVKEYNNLTGFQKKDGTPHIECRIVLRSKKMADDLFKLNVIPNKSLKLTEVPNIPHDLYRHYIRGFFDGNGSATYYWNKKKTFRNPRIIFYSTYSFCESLINILSEELHCSKPTITKQKNANVCLFGFSNYQIVSDLYNYMYSNMKDELHYCKRKKQALEKYMSEYRDNLIA